MLTDTTASTRILVLVLVLLLLLVVVLVLVVPSGELLPVASRRPIADTHRSNTRAQSTPGARQPLQHELMAATVAAAAVAAASCE